MRAMICEELGFLGIVDWNRNPEAIGTELVISTPDSGASVLVVPTNQEQMIALDILRVAGLCAETRLRTI
jgi:acetate kinase